MRRRDAIVALGGAAVWPLVARAQQAALPVVGFVSGGSPAPFARNVAAFRQGLREAGYTEGHNVGIQYRWAEGRYGDLPRLVDDLVRRGVDVIAATGGTSSATAAKEATQSIPIVFLFGGDPVQMGLVASLNRPGGNATGVNMLTGTLNAKRLDFLRELVGPTTPIAVLLNPENRSTETQSAAIGEAARILGQQAHFVLARSEAELEGAFRAAREKAGGLLVAADPFYFDRREQVIALAARFVLPAIYEQREFSAAGGLMSYGASITDAYRQSGLYVGRVLKARSLRKYLSISRPGSSLSSTSAPLSRCAWSGQRMRAVIPSFDRI